MERNNLYPVFLKVSQLSVLIVGGGKVALEKLSFLLKSSPNAQVTMVSIKFREELIALAKRHQVLLVHNTAYSYTILKDQHLVIAATNNFKVNNQVYNDAKERHLLVNVADTPDLCDFFLGGIVTKGNIKIAISAIFGVIAVARSPSSAIAIISETKAKGNYTDIVLSVTIAMDVVIIIFFALIISFSQLLILPESSLSVVFCHISLR